MDNYKEGKWTRTWFFSTICDLLLLIVFFYFIFIIIIVFIFTFFIVKIFTFIGFIIFIKFFITISQILLLKKFLYLIFILTWLELKIGRPPCLPLCAMSLALLITPFTDSSSLDSYNSTQLLQK